MLITARKTASTVAALAALGFGGATIADAASNAGSTTRPARGEACRAPAGLPVRNGTTRRHWRGPGRDRI